MRTEMLYENELKFMWDMFEKCHLQVTVLAFDQEFDSCMDLGLRKRLGVEEEYTHLRNMFARIVSPGCLYRMTDMFFCSYFLLELPHRENRTILIVGPYLAVEIDRRRFHDNAVQLGLDEVGIDILFSHYASVPQLAEQTICAPLETFCERLWGKDGFALLDINQELNNMDHPISAINPRKTPEEVMRKMEEMEQRYAFENELIRAVSLGLDHKVEFSLSTFSQFAFERRLADPVRNIKNYAIVMNTLLRKAAEQGGVHPLYIDRTSSDYARRIEKIGSAEAGHELMSEIYHGYCRLVRRHAMKNYSTPIRRAITHIGEDLAGEVSLKSLAELLGMNASYLSRLFRKETGQTVTEYINSRRMQLASRLLSGSELQIQTVAQHCGIHDVNYFTKVFKKYTGKTPGQFRQDSLRLAKDNPKPDLLEE